MKRSAVFMFVLAAMFVFSSEAFAQAESEKGSIEGIFGAGYTKPNYFTEKSQGYDFLAGFRFRVSLVPERENIFNRLGAFGAFEYTPVSNTKFSDPFLGQLKASESFLVIKTGLSFAVIQRDRFELLVNAGPAFTRNRLTFAAPDPYYGGWQNICRYLVDGTCQSSWSVRSSFEPAVRIYPQGREKHFYIGGTYDVPLKRYGFIIGASF